MTILEAPAFLAANADSCYTYRVQLSHLDADSVLVEVRAPNGDFHSTFALYDDGGTGSAFPDYACAGSGDIVPNNGQFTRRINAQMLADSMTGDYSFTFRAPEVSDQSVTVQIENVEPCLITSWPQTQTFATCFDPVTLEVRVSRSEADVVDTVRMYTESLDFTTRSQQDFVPVSGDTVWQTTLTPQFFECIGPCMCSMMYIAKTRFGLQCGQEVTPLTYTNELPVLANSTLPDTAYRPPADSVLITMTVDLTDCELEGATDFRGEQDAPGVKFDVYRDSYPWGHFSNYFLRDDGISPDVGTGDGTYSSWLVIQHNDTLFNNLYYFRFYAVECAAPFDTSEFLLDSIRIIQSPGPLLSGNRERRDARSHYPILN